MRVFTDIQLPPAEAQKDRRGQAMAKDFDIGRDLRRRFWRDGDKGCRGLYLWHLLVQTMFGRRDTVIFLWP